MAFSPALVEINVTDAKGTVLTSSNPSRDGSTAAPLQKLADWEALPIYRRLLDLMARGRDYQVEVPLGIAGQAKPLFLIQVVASSVLLRGAVLPEVETLAAVSGAALLVSLAITVLVTSRVLRPCAASGCTIRSAFRRSWRSWQRNRRMGGPPGIRGARKQIESARPAV